MVSTFLDYNLIARDMRASLKQVSEQVLVSREQAYYKENIGKVTTVDEFLDDYRLYSYAMKAHGLEEMTYAKAFMRKVLESDLSDEDSYANRLSDDRYRDFATAFNFTAGTAVAQTDSQLDEVIGLYNENVAAIGDDIDTETSYYDAVIDTVTTVEEFLGNERLKEYAMKAYGLDTRSTSYEYLRNILTSDVNDPGSFVNSLGSSTALNFALAFNFQTDGTLPAATLPQNTLQKGVTEENYVLTGSSRVTPAAALLNQSYYEANIGSITNVTDLLANSRMRAYVIAAFGLPSSTLTATVENVLTSDPNDPASYVNTQGGEFNAAYKRMRAEFNFQTDGTLAVGDSAQTAAQVTTTSQGYLVHYNDKDDAADAALIATYRTRMAVMDNVTDLTGNSTVLKMVLTAFDLENEGDSARKIRKVLTSDLNDPQSYVYQLGDSRYLELAKAYNFNPDGTLGTPMLAQSQADILSTSSAYVIEKSRFGTDQDREKATAEASYYSSAVEKLDTLDDLLANRRIVDFILTGAGIDDVKSVTTSYLRQMFESDLDDPESFINTEPDSRYRDIVASFNFDANGKVVRLADATIQSRRGINETMDLYLNQTLEQDRGAENPGLRLALYFNRQASTISTAYDILADPALLQVMQTTFSIPESMSSADIDLQFAYLNRVINVEDLHDPEKLRKLLVRFTALYDVNNNSDTSAALSILSASGSSTISSDTLLTLTQLRSGGF